MLIINNSKSSGPVLSLRDINSSDLMLWLINYSKSSGPLLPLLNISSLDLRIWNTRNSQFSGPVLPLDISVVPTLKDVDYQ